MQTLSLDKYIEHLKQLGILITSVQIDEMNSRPDDDMKMLYLIDLLLNEKARRHFKYKLTMRGQLQVTAWQEELTIERSYKLLALFTDFDLENIGDLFKLDFKKILQILSVNKLLEKFFDIILYIEPKAHPLIDYSLIRTSDALSIIKDFFLLNPVVMQLFTGTQSSQVTQLLTSMLQISKSNQNENNQNS